MKTTLQLLLIVLVFSSVAAAQDGPPRDGKHRERLEQLRRIKLIESLGLDEERAVRFTVREKEFRTQQQELREKRETMLAELRALVESEGNDASLRTQLEKLAEHDARMLRQRHAFLLSLGDFLTMRQIATIVLFEQQFAREVRHLIEKSRRAPRR
ncbi:MAG: hypothetical protein RBU27_02450 [Bacteroidota bacterium]|jgi:hypothetical protein|nr:hypothetical protein [Bacteroidota bacterium]